MAHICQNMHDVKRYTVHTKKQNIQGSYFVKFYKKPTLGILHGQLVGFHFFISFLNLLKDSTCRITGGISSQILGPKYDATRYHINHFESVG